jgi:hypothetical protein
MAIKPIVVVLSLRSNKSKINNLHNWLIALPSVCLIEMYTGQVIVVLIDIFFTDYTLSYWLLYTGKVIVGLIVISSMY